MERQLVSVVVPVFNGAEHLEECLESILAQTYDRWEGIVINNRSTDNTGDIAEAVALRDRRLRVIHCSDFLSQQENYNRAIAAASPNARYLKIVEADNWIMPECIERMVCVAEADSEVGIVGSYYLYGRRLQGEGLPLRTVVVEGREVCRNHLLDKVYYLGAPTTLLFRAEALHAVFPVFEPGLFFDDVDLCFRVLRDWKFCFVHQVLAFLRHDNAGIMSSYWGFDFVPAQIRLLVERYGSTYLSEDEHRRVLRQTDLGYRKRLGRAAVIQRSQAYWDFHKRVFRLMGRELRWKDLAWPVAIQLIDMALNPKSTFERAWKRVCGNTEQVSSGVIADLD